MHRNVGREFSVLDRGHSLPGCVHSDYGYLSRDVTGGDGLHSPARHLIVGRKNRFEVRGRPQNILGHRHAEPAFAVGGLNRDQLDAWRAGDGFAESGEAVIMSPYAQNAANHRDLPLTTNDFDDVAARKAAGLAVVGPDET